MERSPLEEEANRIAAAIMKATTKESDTLAARIESAGGKTDEAVGNIVETDARSATDFRNATDSPTRNRFAQQEFSNRPGRTFRMATRTGRPIHHCEPTRQGFFP